MSLLPRGLYSPYGQRSLFSFWRSPLWPLRSPVYVLSAISDVGTYAQGSSQELGTGVVNASSTALLSLGEDYLVSVVSDQAYTTDVIFEETESEMSILAAQTKECQHNAPLTPITPVYPGNNPPPDPILPETFLICTRRNSNPRFRGGTNPLWPF